MSFAFIDFTFGHIYDSLGEICESLVRLTFVARRFFRKEALFSHD
jgi:hypothetical protein